EGGAAEGGQIPPDALAAAEEGEAGEGEEVAALAEVEERFAPGEGFQHGAEPALRPLRALGDQRAEPVAGRQEAEDPAGVAIGEAVQDEGGRADQGHGRSARLEARRWIALLRVTLPSRSPRPS